MRRSSSIFRGCEYPGFVRCQDAHALRDVAFAIPVVDEALSQFPPKGLAIECTQVVFLDPCRGALVALARSRSGLRSQHTAFLEEGREGILFPWYSRRAWSTHSGMANPCCCHARHPRTSQANTPLASFFNAWSRLVSRLRSLGCVGFSIKVRLKSTGQSRCQKAVSSASACGL